MNDFMRRLLFLPEQRSTLARDVDGLHYFVIVVTMVGAVGVALLTAYFLFKYRRGSAGARRARDPALSGWSIPLAIELALVVGLMFLFVLWWVIGFRQFVQFQRVPEHAMPVYVTGKKWMWSFAYPDGSGTQDVLYVPVNRPIKLIMTSRDVIHSFFVPAFRVKYDVIPGRVTTMWFEVNTPGVYPILCTEYCGVGHSTMRGRVIALAEEEYEARLMEPAYQDLAAVTYLPRDERMTGVELSLAEVGERVANRHGCLRCHTVDGTPHIGPTWAGAYGSLVPLETGETVIADEAYLTESMMDPLARMHRGYAPVMPSYQGILSAAEVGALVEYIRSLRAVPTERSPAALPIDPADPEGETIIELPTRYDEEPRESLSPGDLPDMERAQ